MTLEEYREKIHQDMAILASANDSSESEEFLLHVTTLLNDADEFDDFYECHAEGVTRRRANMEIDGYAIDDADRSCCVFYVDYKGGYSDEDSIHNKEIDEKFNLIRHFVEECIRYNVGFDESTQEYELNMLLHNSLQTISKFRFYIITDAVNKQRVKHVKDIEIEGKIVERNVWDITRIFDLENSTSQKESVEINFKEYDDQGLKCIKAVEYLNIKSDIESSDENGENKSELISYDSYLAVIPGNILSDLYIEHGSRLLEGNVRSFLSVKGAVNKGIRRTIVSYPEMFFAYNNGIAATATEIKTEMTPEGLAITYLKDLQIVNGGQTTASIANAVLNPKKDEDIDVTRLFVPMKISVLSREMSEKIIPKISEYSNSQNKVDPSDFFSNHPFNIRMEDFSKKVPAPAVNGNQYQQYWFYERTRGQYNQGKMKLKAGSSELKSYEKRYPANQVIKLVDLAKYMEIYKLRPDIVSKGKQAIVRTFASDVKTQWEKNETQYNAFYFKRLVALAILFNETDMIIREKQWYKESHSYKANVIAYTLSLLIDILKTRYDNHEIDYLRIWNRQELYPELRDQISELVGPVYRYITSENRPIQNVTEWCKKEECWKTARAFTKWPISADFLITTVSKEELESVNKEAKSGIKLKTEVEGLTFILNSGTQYWNKVYAWGNSRKLLTEKDVSFLRLAGTASMPGKKLPTDKQIEAIMNLRDRLIKEGMPIEL